MDIATARAMERLSAAQCGVARREQFYELGIERRTLHRRIQEGQWAQAGRRVLVRSGTADTLLTRSLIAAQATHPDGTLTGWSALAADGLLGQDPWNVVPSDHVPWLRVGEHRKVRARVIRAKPAKRPRMIRGVPVADRDQVVADLLRYLPFDEGRRLLLRLAQVSSAGHLATLIQRTLDQVGTGRGARQLRDLAGVLTTGAQSDAEQELIRLLRDAGFRDFVTTPSGSAVDGFGSTSPSRIRAWRSRWMAGRSTPMRGDSSTTAPARTC